MNYNVKNQLLVTLLITCMMMSCNKKKENCLVVEFNPFTLTKMQHTKSQINKWLSINDSFHFNKGFQFKIWSIADSIAPEKVLIIESTESNAMSQCYVVKLNPILLIDSSVSPHANSVQYCKDNLEYYYFDTVVTKRILDTLRSFCSLGLMPKFNFNAVNNNFDKKVKVIFSTRIFNSSYWVEYSDGLNTFFSIFNEDDNFFLENGMSKQSSYFIDYLNNLAFQDDKYGKWLRNQPDNRIKYK